MPPVRARSNRSSSADSSFDLYLQELAPLPPLLRAEEQALAIRAKAGDDTARTKLVQHNLRFVVKVAKAYRGYGLGVEDLVSEGNLGLLRAVDRYDPDEGVRLLSYAVWWIKQGILLALATHGPTLTMPTSRAADLFRLRKADDTAARVLGRAATLTELAQLSALSEDTVQAIRAAHDAPTVALDGPGSCATGVAFSDRDTLMDDSTGRVEQAMDTRRLAGNMTAALTRLPARDAHVIRRYYGLGDHAPQTLEQIAATMQLTRERVRQLRNRALDALHGDTALQAFAPQADDAHAR